MTQPTRLVPADFLSEPSVRRFQMVAALIITALGAALHGSFLLHFYALWRDEVNSVGLATMPTLRDLWASLSFDSSPVLWPLVLRGWISGFGSSDASLRVFGFLTQLFLLGGLWFNARAVSGRAPLFSLLLVGFQADLVLWPSLRSYGLGAGLMLWTMGAMWRALENPTRKRVATVFLLALLSVQCVYANVLLLGAICMGGVAVCLSRGDKKQAILPVVVFGISALSLLIYIPTFLRIAPWQTITLSAVEIPSASLLQWMWIALVLFCALSAPLAWRNARRRRQNAAKVVAQPRTIAPALIYAFVCALLSFTAMILFLERAGRQPYPWHFVGLIAVLGSCLDWFGFGLLKSAKWQASFSLAALLLALGSFSSVQQAVATQRTNVADVAAYLDGHAHSADLVVLTPFYYGVTYARYSQGKTPWATVPDVRSYRIQRYDIAKNLMGTSNSLDRVQNLIAQTLRAGHRVWFVGALAPPPSAPPRYVLPAAFGKNGWIYTRYEFYCAQQISYFLSEHGTSRTAVPLPRPRRLSSLEIADVECVQGWKTEVAR